MWEGKAWSNIEIINKSLYSNVLNVQAGMSVKHKLYSVTHKQMILMIQMNRESKRLALLKYWCESVEAVLENNNNYIEKQYWF